MKRKIEQIEIVEEGNTSTSSIGKKQIVQSKRWCFTWNNYKIDSVEQIEQIFDKLSILYIIGKEVGESGTQHLQGYIETPKKLRPTQLGLDKAIHWEKCKGSRADNVEYCSKDGDFVCSRILKPRRKLKLITPDYDWEKEILRIIEDEPDERTIHWYWSRTGNMGKTQFCKYLTVKHGAIPVSGKGADVRNAVVEYSKKHGDTPELVVFPIPKSYNTDYLSYESLENIKDMYFYSGKYEGGAVCGPCPHLFVFANEPPQLTKCSADRWKVFEIGKEEDHSIEF